MLQAMVLAQSIIVVPTHVIAYAIDVFFFSLEEVP